jgi:hypothetical protein
LQAKENIVEKTLHRKISVISLIVMGLITILCLSGLIFLDWGMDIFLPTWSVSMIFPLLTLLTSYMIAVNKNKRIVNISKYVTYAYPLLFTASGFIIWISNTNSIFIVVIMSVFLLVITILAVLHLFIFSNPGGISSNIIFILLIIFCVVLKRFHIMFSGPFLITSISLFAFGTFMYGVRCLYISEKNRFLKYASFLGSFVITLFLMSIMWKFQHWWGNDFLVACSMVLLVAGTIIILLTLPSSGYLDWSIIHKKILKRLIIPWIFIFTLFIIRYLLPELDSILWTKQIVKTKEGFGMIDYKIDVKNNLKPDQPKAP